MKNFRQLVQEFPSKKVVMAFGRFQPPTTGHELLVEKVKKIALAQKIDHIIFASRTQDKKTNPLPVDKKVYYLKRMFPGINFVAANDEVRTIVEAAKFLSTKYKNLILIAGSDRIPAYKELLNKYNGKEYNFETIDIISAGERDPDSDSATGMSGTKMREAAKDSNFTEFKKGLPSAMTELDGKRLMNDVRIGLKLDPIKESVSFEKNDLREKYFKQEIFLIGEKVSDGKNIFEIVDRGSNYLTVVNESGDILKKWLTDVQQVTVSEDITLGQAEPEITYKGYRTKNFHHSADASKAFQDTIARAEHHNHDAVAILNALKATDIYMGLNDKHIQGEKFTDDEKETWIQAHDKAREYLNRIGEFEHHEDYWHMHQHELESALIGYGEEGKQDAMDESVEVKKEKAMKYSASDKIKVARIIASALGTPDVEKSQSAENLVNAALRKIKNKPMRPEYAAVLSRMLSTAKDAGIDFDENLVSNKIEEAISVMQGDNLVKAGSVLVPDLGPERDHIRKKKIRYHLGEEEIEDDKEEDFDEDDIKELTADIDDEDLFSVYDDDELHIIDDETGEKVSSLKEEVEVINEVLSRAERIRAKMRFARTASKRERRLKIALHTRSSPKKINDRARRLAVIMLKKKIAKKPLNTLSVAEKERIERVIQNRKAVISRIALRLAPRVKKIENDRLTHSSYTKG